MKNLYLYIIYLFTANTIFAQAPQKISYQSVIRDASNNLVTGGTIGMQISIIQGTVDGTAVYVETQTLSTTVTGVASILIGTGSVVSGVFADIDWANGPYFIKTETDPAGGTNYTITGTSQLLSVPCALFADSVIGPQGEVGDQGLQGPAGAAGTDTRPTYAVGDFAQGGIVFWVDETGKNGLVCAKTDQSTGIRCYAGTNGNTRAKGDGPYAGELNTRIIVSAQVAIGDDGATYAARICNELQITEGGKTYGDWYLPSKEELNLMYQNKAVIDATATANGGAAFVEPYWSSKEFDNTFMWRQDFTSGIQSVTGKSATFDVRAVRAF